MARAYRGANRWGMAGALFTALVLTGCVKSCGGTQTGNKTADTGDASEQASGDDSVQALSLKDRSISINFSEEPKTMDAQKASDTIAFMLLGHAKEGLMRMDPSNRVFPAQAESYERKSKTEYVFEIRDDAKWHDGEPVRAQDFAFAWKRGVDPKTASQYAFILYPLKNAEAINKGEMEPDSLGVEAVDDKTLRVELERPTAYFLRLLAFGTYYPTRKDYVEQYGDKYAADEDKIAYNGPFVISSWKHNASIKLSKSESYWNKDDIWLEEIHMPYLIRDRNSEFNMFKDGKFAMTWALNKEVLPEAQRSQMQIRKYSDGSVWYYQVNTDRKITGNQNFRKALQVAVDREEFIKQVYGIPGTNPSYGIIPEYMPGVEKRYGDEYSVEFEDARIEKAKEYLAKAKEELGIDEFPTLSILASDTDTARRDMEYFQNYFKEHLGLKFDLDFQTFKIRLQRVDEGNYDLAYYGWGPDYLDAMTFADLFTSWNENNGTGWESERYDSLIRKAQNTLDQKARLDAMHQANEVLVEEAPIIPLYQRSRVYTQHPRLVGVIRRSIAPDPDFYYAKITEPVASKEQ